MNENETEQVPVWVKLVDVSTEVKQGYRPVGVFLTELPTPSFGYIFRLVGLWIAALFLWGLILSPLFIILTVIGGK